MGAINKSLKIKLYMLSLVFPLSFTAIGIIAGYYYSNDFLKLILGLIGFITGVLLNITCYYRKVFTIVLFQAPLPIALFLLVWWVSNGFTDEVYSLVYAVLGGVVGLWLNKELVLPYQFYKIKKRILAILYFFFSLLFTGFFMGIPVFNLLLGFIAGNYLSIRVISNYKQEKQIEKNLKQGAVFTSMVLLFIISLSVFIMWADMENTTQNIYTLFNINIEEEDFIKYALFFGSLLVIIQYFITIYTSKTMLQLWKYKRFRRYVATG